jgi:hypothetical protein
MLALIRRWARSSEAAVAERRKRAHMPSQDQTLQQQLAWHDRAAQRSPGGARRLWRSTTIIFPVCMHTSRYAAATTWRGVAGASKTAGRAGQAQDLEWHCMAWQAHAGSRPDRQGGVKTPAYVDGGRTVATTRARAVTPAGLLGVLQHACRGSGSSGRPPSAAPHMT